MASKKTKTKSTDTLPFGAGALDDKRGASVAVGKKTGASRSKKAAAKKSAGKKPAGKKVAKKAAGKKAATKKASAKKTVTKKKVVAKKIGTKKAAAKKTATKKTAAKKTATKKAATKKAATKKTAAKKTGTTKSSTKKAAAKKSATKKAPAKKAAPKKTAAKKTAAKKTAAKKAATAKASAKTPGRERTKSRATSKSSEAVLEESLVLAGQSESAQASQSDSELGGSGGQDGSEQQVADSPWTDGATLSRRAEKRKRWKERRQNRANSRRKSSPEGQAAIENGLGEGAQASSQKAKEHASDAPMAQSEPSPWAVAKTRREVPSEREAPRGSGWERRPSAKAGRRTFGGSPKGGGAREVEGILVLEKMNHGHLRSKENHYFPTKDDAHVAPQMVQRLGLREGAVIQGRVRPGQSRHRWELSDVLSVDGAEPRAVRSQPVFKRLTSIDPDFHYAVGDGSGEVSLKVVDILCPIGRGQRGLIVAPPRSGKTVLMQQFAHAVEKIYPEVHLMVLLVDERPEEATEWKRSLTTGEVFVSTNDESPKCHVELSEVVWARAKRLVEMGEDVILLLDSITRLGRAYNNVYGNSGKTMSGGIDSRALERPKQFFGAARNTETAGSLTILGTTLIETGSRMDQVIFEEFKGTGNMELVLARRLADRRIFPAIDLERSGTRKEEKLLSTVRHRRCSTLRRVLMRMHWAEAMELLITKLDGVEKIDDFLQRFDIDPEA